MALTMTLGALSVPASAVIDNAVSQTVWKMLYGVTDAQINDAVWLAKDDDGDGISNGNEIAAGTNPFSAGSAIKITSTTSDTNSFYFTFPSSAGKQYVLQTSNSLGTSAIWSLLSPSVSALGTGADVTLIAPKSGANSFFRVLVQDVDSDGDGVSDWAERAVGFNPNSASSVTGTDDHTALVSGLAAENTVTITTNKGTATQPPDTTTPATDLATVTITRSGSLHFNAVTVNLAKSGSALEGTDYTSLPASVTFSPHTSSITLTVVPKAVPTRVSNASAIVKVLAGVGYNIGGSGSAGVVINPAANANGSGLSANYQNTASTNYTTQTGLFAGTAEMSRTDATIDFTTTVSPGWGAVAGPTGMSPASTTGAFSVRWTGQVLPQYTETYNFDIRSDDGAKLWVNGVLLVDNWVSQGVTDKVNSIKLQAGVLYDIQVDYFNAATGSAEAHLYWWSPSQTKQIIPQSRLFPAPALSAKPTAVTAPLAAYGYVGTPFSLTVTTPNISGTVTYSIPADSGSLPPGLTLPLNSTTGVISGTPTTAGNYNVAVHATNAASGTVTGASIINFTIYPTGSVTREILTATGPKVSDIAIPSGTPTHDTISTVDDDVDYTTNTGERLRGYIVPPKTGNYYFWLAANNAAELWISNDGEYVNKVKRATVTASTGKYTWNTQVTQRSPWLNLIGGQKYYFEVLHNTGADADTYVEMGWCQDDIGTIPAVVGAPNATGALTLIPNGAGATLQGYPLSGKAPSFLFQPYDYPVLGAITGTIYSANLGPQGSSTTKASGAANLVVNQAGTSAVLHFNYSGLSAPRTAYHLHTDGFIDSVSVTHPAGEIIFDIDDVDAFHPELRTADGGYIWNFGAVGSFAGSSQILDAVQKGKVYLNIHSVAFPAGEIRGNLTAISGSQTPPTASLYPEPTATDSSTNTANAVRFLNQATFGASPADTTYVTNNGFTAWINNQLTLPASHMSNDVVAGITADINQPYPSALFTNTWWKYSITGQDQLRQRLAFAMSEIMVVSWNNDSGPLAFNGRILADYYDQLIDFVLPTSGLQDSGTFRGILKNVTLTPAMGLYLDMRGNQKGDDTIGRHPNENYAREIMQLFSVGIYRQWDDGRFVLDSGANLPATYTQSNILGMAALLTGWNYNQANQANGRAPTNFGPGADYLNPMVLVPSQHDMNPKLLLNNVMIPQATGLVPRVTLSNVAIGSPCTVTTASDHGLATGDTVMISNVTGGTFSTPINASFQATVTGARTFTVASNCTAAPSAYTNAAVTGATVTPAPFGTSGLAAISGSQADSSGTTLPHPYDQFGLKELDSAIDNIVNNDNVPPYICRQLIQRLVTSTPSPGYLFRVVQKFKDNGSGVRGDLAAVVRQILLDGEARSTTSAFASSSFGKQREPLLRVTGPARAFPASSFTGTYTQLTGVDSNKLRIVTSQQNDYNTGFSLSLDFKSNYTSNNPLTPYNNPTSAAYIISSTLGVASTSTEISSVAVGTGATTIITTVQPHGLSTGNTVTISGVCGTFSPAINATLIATVVDANTFTVPVTMTRTFQIASISTGNPCTITTTAPHGMSGSTNTVTINGVTGGTFSTTINGTFTTATFTGTNTFTVASNCTVVPTAYPLQRHTSNPCRVTTTQPHGLTTGGTVTISGVTGGTYSPTINGTFTVTVVDPTSFTVASNCTVTGTSFTSAQVVGANTLDVPATGIANTGSAPYGLVTYSQALNSNTLTVNTAGPQTDVPVPGTATTIKSRVYISFVNQTSSGGAAKPADGIYDVQTVNGTTSFTVTTADTPTLGARSGNVVIPKITTSYTPSGNIVQFNNNVNHNLQVGQHVWVDVPSVVTPLSDAEYAVVTIVDEDHFTTSNQPTSLNGGTYSAPSGSNNSVTIWPLVPAPTGRIGNVTINSSTFNIGSTEGSLTQSPLNSPTVFNYFFPNYKYPGTLSNTGTDSPEFQLTTDTNVANLTNSVVNMFIGTGGGNSNANGLSSFNNGSGTVVMDIGDYMTDAQISNAGVPALIDTLAAKLVGGPLEAATKTAIQNFVANTTNFPLGSPITNTQRRDRVRAIIHLILTSAEYAVQK